VRIVHRRSGAQGGRDGSFGGAAAVDLCLLDPGPQGLGPDPQLAGGPALDALAVPGAQCAPRRRRGRGARARVCAGAAPSVSQGCWPAPHQRRSVFLSE
jgi:hypothetical protein